MNRRQHWTGSAKGSFFQLFTLLKDKIASWARICAAYESATSEFKLAVSDYFPLNAIIWSHSCPHGEAALHTLPMFLFTETIPPEGSPLFNFTLCSPFVSFSKYGSIRNTHQTSGNKKVNSVCAYVRCRKHCITAGLRDQRMREVIQSDDTDQKGVVPSIRASSGGHHCFCFYLRNLTLVHIPSGKNKVIINYLSASPVFELSTWLIFFCIFPPFLFWTAVKLQDHAGSEILLSWRADVLFGRGSYWRTKTNLYVAHLRVKHDLKPKK